MELERWAELSAAVSAVAVGWRQRPKDTHCTALVVRVYLWAALHDRPASWACDAKNWQRSTRPRVLPDQSTMSRRTRRDDFMAFLEAVGRRLNGRVTLPGRGSRLVDVKVVSVDSAPTIAGPPATTSHVECTAAERAAMGIPEALVRYSVGIEDTADLIADLDQALNAEA